MLRMTARAKINWSLDILGKRADGYHDMDMLMTSVSLADTLEIRADDALSLSIEGMPSLDTHSNLVMKAARALLSTQTAAKGARMTLYKCAPVGAGMGGGSADAAAALVGLNRFWALGLTEEQLLTLSASIGADVPFLVKGGLARVGGIGERLVPLPPLPNVPLVIVQPCTALSTPEVFAAFDEQSSPWHPRTDEAQKALLARDFEAFAQATGNVMQTVSERKRPQITEAVAALDALGALPAMMTGSGSAVFGAFASERNAQAAYKLLKKRWSRTWLAETTAEGVTAEEMSE